MQTTAGQHMTRERTLSSRYTPSTIQHMPPIRTHKGVWSTHLHLLEHEGMVADLPQLNNCIHKCSCAASALKGRGGEGRGGRRGKGRGGEERGEGQGRGREGRREERDRGGEGRGGEKRREGRSGEEREVRAYTVWQLHVRNFVAAFPHFLVLLGAVCEEHPSLLHVLIHLPLQTGHLHLQHILHLGWGGGGGHVHRQTDRQTDRQTM